MKSWISAGCVKIQRDMMTPSQTQTVQKDISLQAPPNIKSPFSAVPYYPPSTTRNFSFPFKNIDLELGQASSHPSHLESQPREFATQKETRQKILARRTFWATLAFGVLTLIYEAVSLLPAFHSSLSAAQGVNLQVKSEADSRQALAYSFLQECENRKAQNLPLGEDCIKNLAKTPKAPPDIDDWLMDAPVSRLRAFMLMVRSVLVFAKRAENNRNVYVCIDSSDGTWRTITIILWVLLERTGMISLVQLVHRYLSDRLFVFLGGRTPSWNNFLFVLLGGWTPLWMNLKPIGKVKMLALGIVTVASLLLELEHLLQTRHKHQRWTNSMNFMASCQLQSDLGVSLGEDCVQYLSRKLKPQPSLDLEDKIGLALIVIYVLILTICIRFQLREYYQNIMTEEELSALIKDEGGLIAVPCDSLPLHPDFNRTSLDWTSVSTTRSREDLSGGF
ncbi:uncharacterized protein PAC_04468 [Phialocephala subalpina]|uniref:Uncharacterized protein n=1 Tax=Phialocephala subalpina TaxID=576137 RepID=A0A1L7WP87_9HELO|nr:uncharacterized protein PAC_04468 [Phialocephala subalpina]